MNLYDLRYSEKCLEEDLELFLKTGVYRPSYADAVKAFLSEDTEALTAAFPRRVYFFMHFSDDLAVPFKGKMPQTEARDAKRIMLAAENDAAVVRADASETRHYAEILKKACPNGVGSITLKNGRTMLAAVCRFLRSPLYSVWLAAGIQCRALMSAFGAPDVSSAVLEGVFGASYIYLRGAETGGVFTDKAAEWCADNSAAESLRPDGDLYFFEYSAVKKALDVLRRYGTAGFYAENGVDFKALYDFSVSIAEACADAPARSDVAEAEERAEKTAEMRRTVMEDICAELANGVREGEVFKRYAERMPSMAKQIERWRDMTRVRDFVRVKMVERAHEAMFKTRGERQRDG